MRLQSPSAPSTASASGTPSSTGYARGFLASEEDDSEDEEAVRNRSLKPPAINVPWTKDDLNRIYNAKRGSLPPQEAKLQRMMKIESRPQAQGLEKDTHTMG